MIPSRPPGCQVGAFSAVFLLILLASSPSANATVWSVRADGSGDFDTIGAALATAAVADTVEVGPGTWHESLTRTGSIVLRSEGAPEATVLDGGMTSSLLLLAAGEGSEIEGLTFTRGLRDEGGAIRVSSGSATVRSCVFLANSATQWGGAILADAGVRLVVEGCLFRDNGTPEVGTGPSDGGAIASRFSRSVEIRGCTFEGNLARRGGAIALNNTATARVQDCVFRENVAMQVGGAIRFVRTYFEIERDVFVGNRCVDGAGGVFHAQESDGLFRQNLHVENEAAVGGVGALTASRLRFLNETVVACRALRGPAIRLADFSEAFVRNDIFADLAGSPIVSCEADCTLWSGCNLAWGLHTDPVRAGPEGDCSVEATALAADPRFCGDGDYHLRLDSPAANVDGCGLLGAFDPTCAPLSEAPLSWARVKASYR